MSRFYVTTPIYYVNDAPHIGHAYTTVLADVLARYKRLFGEETYFLTGTDEHGQKVQQAAAKRGIDPNDTQALREYCDGYAARFKEAWKELNIGYDRFIRTTEGDHVAFVRAQFAKLQAKGLIYTQEYAGWYSTTEERFFGEDELVDGKDPISGRAVEWITEKNYFFKMSAFKERLVEHIEKNPGFIAPEFRKNEVLGFLRQDLNDLCISRPKSRLAWGVPLPFDEDYVSYVWVDALLNYVTASKLGSPNDAKAPEWPASLHLIGKDILTTHAVYFTTLLMALDLDLPKQILAHGWWLVDNARMSKTTGNVVAPLDMSKKFGVDAFRFFLIRAMVVGQDASFTEDSFITTINADLANDVGNGLSRMLKLGESLGALAFPENSTAEDGAVKAAAAASSRALPGHLAKVELSHSVEVALTIFRQVNKYFEATAPWKLAKGTDADKDRLKVVLWHAAEALRIGFTLLHPVMPGKMDEALAALGFTYEDSRKSLEWRSAGTFSLKPIAPLFPRIEVKKTEAPATAPAAPSDPFSILDLRAVKILSAGDHPDAEALYVLKIDAGDEESRTVCAGLRKHLTKDEITGRMAVLVANLKPAKLRGIESHGMLLAADAEKDAEGKPTRLSLALPENAAPGDAVTAQGVPAQPKAQITIKDFDKITLAVKAGIVSYGEKPLSTTKGSVTAQAPDGAGVH
ncbi:MAG TPA: methionine--tRNA ligase [Fibrobacteria bacterium]|jgi:methionyl-tRNA synthetase|nr:methionine--tRNA ligase [Fibrobacteria bacterium]